MKNYQISQESCLQIKGKAKNREELLGRGGRGGGRETGEGVLG